MIGESQQQAFDEMEVRVFRDPPEGYMAEISMTDDRASCRLPNFPPESVFSETDLRSYGIQLFEWLFRDDLLQLFRRARWSTETLSRSAGPVSGVRFRLWLEPQATELHCVWWEALHDPTRDEPLTLDMPFSRFMRVKAPRGWAISERPLRMLIATSNPEGLGEFGLTTIDVALERELISKATRSVQRSLDVNKTTGAPTLGNLRRQLESGYHIIHVLAHATLVDGRGCLILESADGKANRVRFEEVADLIAHSSREVPYFVFLATPMTASDQRPLFKNRSLFIASPVGEALVRLAPMLIEAGVQAVVAVQAPIDNQKLWLFIERFYNVLIRTGVIDMAMAEARTRIYSPDSWEWAFPVLYMRTPGAQLFHPLPESLEATVRNISTSQ